jgi:hypothetical protein
MSRTERVRAGDVFKDTSGGAATVMQANPGGQVMLRVERGQKVLIGHAKTRDVKLWARLGRAESIDGMYLSALSLLPLPQHVGGAGSEAAGHQQDHHILGSRGE